MAAFVLVASMTLGACQDGGGEPASAATVILASPGGPTFTPVPRPRASDSPVSTVSVLQRLQSRTIGATQGDIWSCSPLDREELQEVGYSFVDRRGFSGTFASAAEVPREFTAVETDVDAVLLDFAADGTQEALSAIRFRGGDAFTADSSTWGRLECGRIAIGLPPEGDARDALARHLRNDTRAVNDTDFWACTAQGGTRVSYVFSDGEGRIAFRDGDGESVRVDVDLTVSDEDAVLLTYVDGSTVEALTDIAFEGEDAFTATSSFDGLIECARAGSGGGGDGQGGDGPVTVSDGGPPPADDGVPAAPVPTTVGEPTPSSGPSSPSPATPTPGEGGVLSRLQTRYIDATNFESWSCRAVDLGQIPVLYIVVSDRGATVSPNPDGSEGDARPFTATVTGADTVLLDYAQDGSQEELTGIAFTTTDAFTTRSSVWQTLDCSRRLHQELPGEEDQAVLGRLRNDFVARDDLDIWFCSNDRDGSLSYFFGSGQGSVSFMDADGEIETRPFVPSASSDDGVVLTYGGGLPPETLSDIVFDGLDAWTANSTVEGAIDCERLYARDVL